MHGYLRSVDVASARGGVSPQDAAAAAQVRNPAGTVPYVMVLLFLVAMYAAAFEGVPPLARLRLPMTLALGALSFLVVERALTGCPFRLPWPEGHALLAFFGAASLSTFNALWPGLAVLNTIGLGKLVVVYVLTVNVVDTRTRLRGLIWTMVLAGVIPAWGTIQNHLVGNVIQARAAWLGKFSGPNEVAFELAILVPLAIALMVKAKWWGRLLLCGAVATYLGGILFTYSRSGILALGAMVAVGIFRLRNPRARALAVACVVVAVAIGVQFWERDQSFANLADDATYRGRFTTMQTGLSMFQASPLFGIGLGCSGIGWQEFSPDPRPGSSVMIHNTYVQVLAETGLVGATFFLLAILVALWRTHRLGSARGFVDPELRLYAAATGLAIIAFVVAGLANGLVQTAAPYLLIALASATRGVVLAEQQPETS